jgi:AcrR family transcriptional regulator
MIHRRERQHAATRMEVKQVARHLMATQGTTAITLRAIALEMGFTSQALYRYFKSRDALLTELIIDAYTDLARTMQSALDARPPDAYGERLFAALMAYRQWAMAHPVDYTLIYGMPIPDYQAPSELVQPAMLRVPQLSLTFLHQVWQQGQLHTLPEYHPLPAELAEQLAAHRTLLLHQPGAYEVPPELLHTMFVIWSRLHGLITLEIFGHLPLMREPETFYRFEVLTLLRQMGLSLGP